MITTQRPDIIVVDAAVHGGPPGATSVAISGGRISAVSRESLRDLAGPRTEIIDAAGGALVPGFTDAHVHPLAAGVQLLTCDLSRLRHSTTEYRDAIRAYADAHPELEWISGNGWYGDTFPGGLPAREFLDEIVPDRPAVFVSHDGHGVWANSRALDLAKIDDRTPDPVNGRINRDGDGRPTGILVERAGDLVTSLLPPLTDELAEIAILRAQSHLHALGVTGWLDACVGPLLGLPDPLPTYKRLAADGRLTARVVGARWWTAEQGFDQLDSLEDRRATSTVGRFRATSVKIMQDGVCENCTGAMLEPYAGTFDHGTASGLSFIDPEELREICRELDRRGFQIHMHAVGDRAVRECLDALETAYEANPGADLRHQIAHVDVVHPQDIARFGALDVVANIQALWARRDKEIVERKLPLLGRAREPHHFPFGALHRAGARIAMGSDWPVTDPNPLWAIYTAATRLGPPEDPTRWARTSSPPRWWPINHLIWRSPSTPTRSARRYANHRAHEVGRIEIGYLADLAVLDRPIFGGDIGSARTVLTLVGGQAVHREI